MKKIIFTVMLTGFLMAGCEGLRFAPSENQKQNAWLHSRTTTIASDTARDENVSEKLKALTRLSDIQSRALTGYYGMPSELPKAYTADDILDESNFILADVAISESVQRPDAWQLADSAMELGIALSALLGGIYGTRAVKFLKDAREKSKALKEIIQGNEIFKQLNSENVTEFKDAHKSQSPQTRQIVSAMKS